jgi:hypothetical protein
MRSLKLLYFISALVLTLGFLPQLASAEIRCGWVDNPTPGNWWLTDRDGEWTLMLQGNGDRDNGFLDVPSTWDFQDQWRETNGSYGYGCGCFEGEVDKTTNWVTKITMLKAKTLEVCEGDPALPSR